MARRRAGAIQMEESETVTQTSRRQMMKVFVAGAAIAATSTSFLDAAFGQADSGEMALVGGGRLLLERRDGRWIGIVVDPEGPVVTEPNGWVIVEGGRMIGLENGLVVDGTVVSKDEDFIKHTDVIEFKQYGSAEQTLSSPLWASGPVLESQAPLMEAALDVRAREQLERRTPTLMPEITPTVPGAIAPTPGQGVSPPVAPAPRTTR